MMAAGAIECVRVPGAGIPREELLDLVHAFLLARPVPCMMIHVNMASAVYFCFVAARTHI
jgi:hypothetical protein